MKRIRSSLQFVLGLLYLIAIMSSLPACPAVERDIKIAGDVAVSCSMDPKFIADLLPAVGAILTGGVSGWAAQMNALRTALGDAVVCAAAVVQRDEATAAASQPVTAARTVPIGPSPSTAWLMGGHFVIVYPPPQQLKAPLYGPGGTVVYVPGHKP